MITAYTYIGKGEHHYGIPARDLTAEEFGALSVDQRAAVTEGGLYQAVGEAQVAERATKRDTTTRD
jgi:hypothetical protein